MVLLIKMDWKRYFLNSAEYGIANLITLQRVDDNNEIYSITQNSDGSLNSPSLCK